MDALPPLGAGWSLSGALEYVPETRAELHQWIKTYLRTPEGVKVNIPTRRICPGHNAPFEFVADAFFNRDLEGNPVHDQFCHANRYGGKTLNFGTLATVGMFHKGRGKHPLQILNIGAIEQQALKCLSYTSHNYQQDDFIPYIGNPNQDITKKFVRLPNGTMLTIAVATITGVNSPHVPWLHLDEWELWDWAIGQQAFSIPGSSGPHRAAIRIASTQKYALGPMQKFKDHAVEKGFKTYKYCIWETLEQCKDRSCSSCPIFQYPDAQGGPLCGGKAKETRGFYLIDDFIQRARALDRKTLDEEWLCKRPSRQGLVFGDEYDEAQHYPGIKIPYNPNLPLELTIDQGFANAFAVLFIQDDRKNDQVRFIEEIYEHQLIPEQVARLTADRLKAIGYPDGSKIYIIPDPEDPAAARTFAKYLETESGYKVYGLLKYPSGRMLLDERLRLCRRRLKLIPGRPPRAIISRALIKFPWELTQYHYPTPLGEDRPQSEKPVDKDNHAISSWYRWEHYKAKPMTAVEKEHGID